VITQSNQFFVNCIVDSTLIFAFAKSFTSQPTQKDHGNSQVDEKGSQIAEPSYKERNSKNTDKKCTQY